MAVPVLAPSARLQNQENVEEQKDLRIEDLEAAAMIGVAFFYDAAQAVATFLIAIPIFGIIFLVLPLVITIVSFTTFSIWFGLKGVNYFSGKQAATKLLAVFGALVIELLPFIDALPAITGGVVLMILATRIEDTVGKKTFIEPGKLLAKGVPAKVVAQQFMNQEKSERAAAQVAYGKKSVTKEASAGGISKLRGQMQAIEAEAPKAVDKKNPTDSLQSRERDARRRYRIAQEQLRRLREQREAEENAF